MLFLFPALTHLLGVGAPFLLGRELPPVAYITRETSAPAAVRITMTIVHQRDALIGLRELGYGAWLGLGMVAGSWTGKRLAERLPRDRFIHLVETLMVASAMQMMPVARSRGVPTRHGTTDQL